MRSNDSLNGPSVRGTIFTCRLLVFAMATGILLFLGVVLAVVPPGPQAADADAPALLSYVAAAAGATCLMAAAMLPRIIGDNLAKKAASGDDAVAQLARAYLTKTLIAVALLEGGALFNVVAHMLERTPLSLAATGVLLVALMALFPSEDRVTGWIHRHAGAAGDAFGKDLR